MKKGNYYYRWRPEFCAEAETSSRASDWYITRDGDIAVPAFVETKNGEFVFNPIVKEGI
ncbi:hypothetical protein [uncultured Mediterranean phage uvDeep-CGR2-AD3-C191]|nr:hypothetical protein [uncultured Mediterranean phage uvDeep-CGR2-AD3-C191]